MRASLLRRVVAEAVGSALLLVAIVGSGIMADRLSGGSVGLALLANALATGAALVALISSLAPVSGAHLNPVVTGSEASQAGMPWSEAGPYICAQVGGALVGVALANTMFGEPVFSWSQHARSGPRMFLSEIVATFGLVVVVRLCARQRPALTPFAVASYIAAAYWFTPSTSFANPAVTVARALTDTFTGIAARDVPGFLVAQALGAAAATALVAWLTPEPAAPAGSSGRPESTRP